VPDCTIEISLHERERGSVEPAKYLPGETMHFTVTVTTDQEVTIAGLEVFSATEPRGKGFGLHLEGFRMTLFEGTLPPGTHTFEGSAKAPPWPSTYHGDHLGIDWWIHVTADIPWAKDPKSRESFWLRAPQDITIELPKPEGPDDIGSRRKRLRDWERGWLLFAAIALGGSALAFLLRSLNVETELTSALTCMGLGLGLGAFLPASLAVLRRALGGGDRAPIAVAVGLEEGSADVGYRAVQPEERGLTCTVFVELGKRVDVIKGIIELDEWAEWHEGSGDNRTKRQRRTTSYRRAVDMEDLGDGQYRCVLPMMKPPYVCTMADSGGHGLEWRARIHILHSGEKLPLDEIVRPIIVRPVVDPPTG
jgi:hypothetical protein